MTFVTQLMLTINYYAYNESVRIVVTRNFVAELELSLLLVVVTCVGKRLYFSQTLPKPSEGHKQDQSYEYYCN